MSSFENEDDVRPPDSVVTERLIEQPAHIYNASREDEKLALAIERSLVDSMNNQEEVYNKGVRYERQIYYMKKEQEEKDRIEKEERKKQYEKEKLFRIECVQILERLCLGISSPFSSEITKIIKDSVQKYKDQHENYIYLDSHIFENFFKFINSKKHRLSDEYIKTFIINYVKEKINKYEEVIEDDYIYNSDDE